MDVVSAFYRHHCGSPHFVCHWPIVGRFWLSAFVFEPRGRSRTSGGRSSRKSLYMGIQFAWLLAGLDDFQLQYLVPREAFWSQIVRLSRAFLPLFQPFNEAAILGGDNRSGLQPEMGDRCQQKWRKGEQVAASEIVLNRFLNNQ